MRSTVKYLLPAVLASLTLAACGGSSKTTSASSQTNAAATSPSSGASSSGTSAAADAVIKTASNSTLGATVLTNSAGMTLYALSGERAGKFICTASSCTAIWHPVGASGTTTPSGSVSSLGTVKRPDGTEQVTYKGMPLYTFARDQQPGQANGQGIKDVGTWSAVRTGAAATAAKSAAPAPATPSPTSESESSSSGSGGGYAY
jgi:predicted lipoprotein with Yx(FWY)xxD motif